MYLVSVIEGLSDRATCMSFSLTSMPWCDIKYTPLTIRMNSALVGLACLQLLLLSTAEDEPYYVHPRSSVHHCEATARLRAAGVTKGRLHHHPEEGLVRAGIVCSCLNATC